MQPTSSRTRRCALIEPLEHRRMLAATPANTSAAAPAAAPSAATVARTELADQYQTYAFFQTTIGSVIVAVNVIAYKNPDVSNVSIGAFDPTDNTIVYDGFGNYLATGTLVLDPKHPSVQTLNTDLYLVDNLTLYISKVHVSLTWNTNTGKQTTDADAAVDRSIPGTMDLFKGRFESRS